jgi:NAD(P)H-flavin reductase
MKNNICANPLLPIDAEVITVTQESPTIFTLKIRFSDCECHRTFVFHPGQFNMVYLYGVGEIAISIVSDPDEKDSISHTIRAVGRVTHALQTLKAGDHIGIRGPFGKGWPLIQSKGKEVVVITGGLGCAPTVSVINYIIARRNEYGALKILQGMKHSEDFIFREHYKKWEKEPNVEILVAANQVGPSWPWLTGHVTDMIQTLSLNPENTVAMLCGPEMMMHAAINALTDKNVSENQIYLSMERNMECGVGLCGHCQYGGLFICKDGPVFAYPAIKALFKESGF